MSDGGGPHGDTCCWQSLALCLQPVVAQWRCRPGWEPMRLGSSSQSSDGTEEDDATTYYAAATTRLTATTKRAPRWHSGIGGPPRSARGPVSQFAPYSRRKPSKYEHYHTDAEGISQAIGRPHDSPHNNTPRLHLNLKVDVFVYEKDDFDVEGITITRADVEQNRSKVRTLRRIVGEDWAFLEERDVEDILLKNGEMRPSNRSPAFRWNF